MSLVVTRAVGLCTVQDLGRRGHMHEAVPPGGALVRERLIAANRAAGNADGAAAIEVLGQLVVRAAADIVVATDRDGARMLSRYDELTIVSEPLRCTYLAVQGGVDAPVVLGGRGVLLCAGLGAALRPGDPIVTAEVDTSGEPLRPGEPLRSEPLPGEPLRPGDLIRSAGAPELELRADTAPIQVLAGPDLDAFGQDALAVLTSGPYRISPSSDRVGTRLEGPRLSVVPGYRERSRPMVQGALEVPRDGKPIVLGPEHPTTGGYPVIAVIANAELGRFFSIRLGGSVRLAVTSSR